MCICVLVKRPAYLVAFQLVRAAALTSAYDDSGLIV